MDRYLDQKRKKTSAGSEMWKWDAEPFIAHKRSSLTKYSLQQMKDAILTEGHSFLSSFKNQSGLLVGKQPERVLHVPEDNCNGNMPGNEGSDTNTQIDRQNDRLISPILEIGGYHLHKDLPDENLSPVKRKRSSCIENGKRPSKEHFLSKNGGKIHKKSVRKYKHDIICSKQYLLGDKGKIQ